MPAEIVRIAVAAAKRSAAYQRLRARVAIACPADVWTQNNLGFVQFEVDRQSERLALPAWLVFAVRLEDGAVAAAKLLEPGPGELELTVSDLLKPA